MKNLFVENEFYGQTTQLMLEVGDFQLVTDPRKADVIVFTGGSDISPSLYGQEDGKLSYTNPKRDLMCEYIWNNAKPTAKFIGICRGAQFVSAMLGGRLIQHLTSHHGGRHEVLDGEGKVIEADEAGYGFETNSYHHQGILIHEGLGKVIHTSRSSGFLNSRETVHEVLIAESYINDKAFCVQWHPEFIYPNKYKCVRWWIETATEFLK